MTDIEALARILWWEARGEPEKGQIAVCNVILNRARHGSPWPSNIQGVISQPHQFTPYGNSNYFSVEIPKKQTDIAILAMNGRKIVPDHYYYFSVGKATKYAKDFIKIGNHNFGKDIDEKDMVRSYPVNNLDMFVSQNFKLREFFDPVNYLDVAKLSDVQRIKTIQIDDVLLRLLEGLRSMYRETYPDAVITIRPHGGYRPSSPVNLNKLVGGASGSQHRYGKAVDMQVKIAPDKYLDSSTSAIMAEQWMAKNGFKGAIGVYSPNGDYFHLDVRSGWTAWYDTTSSSGTPLSGTTHTQGGRKTVFRRGQKCAGIVLIQRYLITQGYTKVKATGYFDLATYNALGDWQKKHGLKADRLFGAKSNGVAKIFSW